MPLPDYLQTPLYEVIQTVHDYQTAAGGGYSRFLSAIFRDLPSRHDYPDYYQIIKEPRCLSDIKESLRRGAYSSPQAVAYDLFLIWNNAREYNEQGSLVYTDADKLEAIMARAWQTRSPPLPPFQTLPRPGSLPVAPPAPTPADPARKVKKIKLTGASFGTPSTPSYAAAPDVSTKLRLGPSGVSSAASPAPSTPSITLKLGGNRVTSGPSASLPSLPALPPVQSSLPPPQAPPYSSGSAVAGPSGYGSPTVAPSSMPALPNKEKKEKKEKDEDSAPSVPLVPTVPDTESGWMTGDLGNNPTQIYSDIMSRLRDYTDADGRPLSTRLLNLQPISLNSIDAKVQSGAYNSPEAFDRELHSLFESAKLVIKPDSLGTEYGDLVVLQRLYQELTKRRSAFDRTTDLDSASILSSSVDEKSRASRPTTKDKIFLDGIRFKGDVLRVGDWIHMMNPENPAEPVIAQIWKTYKRSDSPQRYLSVCWYYRPDQTVHPASRQFYEHEVFKTGAFIDGPVEDFVSRCFVMFITRYIHGRPAPPAWTPAMPLYVCEYRYKDDVKTFKKIKSWNSCVPDEIRKHEYDFVPYADGHSYNLVKVKSPFVKDPNAPAKVEKVRAKYHFSTDGRPSTAAEVKAAKKEAAKAAAAAVKAEAVSMDVDMADSSAFAPAAGSSSSAMFDLSAFTGVDAGTFDTSSPAASSSNAFPPPAATAAEIAASAEYFAPLPQHIKSKFRNDAFGDLLWFTAPSAEVPAVSRPTHSLEYLYWKATQQQQQQQQQQAMASV